jgi:hypothetical protein
MISAVARMLAHVYAAIMTTPKWQHFALPFASIAVLNMDDAGDIAPAAAMGMMIFYTNVVARLLHMALSHGVLRRTQAWRVR